MHCGVQYYSSSLISKLRKLRLRGNVQRVPCPALWRTPVLTSTGRSPQLLPRQPVPADRSEAGVAVRALQGRPGRSARHRLPTRDGGKYTRGGVTPRRGTDASGVSVLERRC